MEWILILFVHAGVLSDKDSMAVTNVPGFSAQAECEAAGRGSESLAKGTTKNVKWVCVQRKRP